MSWWVWPLAYLVSVLGAAIAYARRPTWRLWTRIEPPQRAIYHDDTTYALMIRSQQRWVAVQCVAVWPIAALVLLVIWLWVPEDSGADDSAPSSGGPYR